jgi:uncharacterized protein (DUF1501 family)
VSERPDPAGGPAEGEEAVICADCAASDSAARDVAPVDHMPIPGEALEGFPDGRPEGRRGWRRAEFLRNAAVGTAAVYAATRIDWTRAFEAAAAEPQPDRKLVMIFLNGGNDGLNTIVPLAEYDAYRGARDRIARERDPVQGGSRVGSIEMPGTDGRHGWAQVCVSGEENNGYDRGFDSIWGDGGGGEGSDLAVFPAADYTPANRSHFDSRDFWFSGSTEKLPTGWLGRWLDRYGSQDNPLQAVSLDSYISKQLRAESAPVSAVSNLNGVRFRVGGVWDGLIDTTEQMAPLSAVPSGPGNAALGLSRSVYGQTVQISRSLGSLQDPSGGAGYPNSSLSRRLQLAATLLAAPLGVRVVTLDWGSFDTHGNQLGSQDPQLRVLSAALAAFRDDLAARGVGDEVLTCVFSEFGRRVDSNGPGTDHGAGGLMMLMGSRVRGGLRGEFPGLTSLDRGDLRVTTDFRSVYGSIVSDWLGGDPAAVIPAGTFGTTLGSPVLR